MASLDLKDKKILYYLSRDSRLSYSQLSRLVRISKNSAKYRIERLLKKNIIDKFACIVNLRASGYDTFTMLVRFNEDIYEATDMLEYFKKHQLSDWVVTLSGQYDIFVEFPSKNLVDMQETISGVIGHFNERINTYRVFTSNETLRVEHLINDFYKDLELEELPVPRRTKKRMGLDSVDKQILGELSKDSHQSLVKISQRLGLSVDVVRYRMNKMKDSGVLIKCFSEINLQKLGYIMYLCIIRLRNLSSKKIESLKRRLGTNNNVSYAFYDSVNSSLVFSCAFKSADSIDHLMRDVRKNFTEIIDSQEYFLIKEQLLFNLFPDGLVQD